ncbi:MAG: 4-alpha-glucanotransferase [Oligoflexales bacterium]|nr:4-alpha-glucanotransferase [Oligoflexales bacterium]
MLTKSPLRKSGIFLPISALPGDFAVGDFSERSNNFIEFLRASTQTYWQILPLNPLGRGNCPYDSSSSFAIDPIYSDVELLIDWKLITASDVEFEKIKNDRSEGRHVSACNYDLGRQQKNTLLLKAFQNLKNFDSPHKAASVQDLTALQAALADFVSAQASWLEGFAEYELCSQVFSTQDWLEWPKALKMRDPVALAQLKFEYPEQIKFTNFCQFVAELSLRKLRKKAAECKVELIGDLPIYVSLHSADVWLNQQFFQLDENGSPTKVSGVPPDQMCPEGQKWNHPLYNWSKLKNSSYSYWINKIERVKQLYDVVRLDHFIGFSRYYEIPAQDENACHGQWQEGPGADFFAALASRWPRLPFIVEDLGCTGEDVDKLRDKYKLPGMAVYLFASEEKDCPHALASVRENSVYYSSTHDTNTLVGSMDEAEPAAAVVKSFWNIVEKMSHSAANTCIFPLQDLLGLGTDSRINIPGTATGNWNFRFTNEQISSEALSEKLKQLGDSTRRC